MPSYPRIIECSLIGIQYIPMVWTLVPNWTIWNNNINLIIRFAFFLKKLFKVLKDVVIGLDRCNIAVVLLSLYIASGVSCLCSYLINSILLCVGFVASNTQMRFKILLFFTKISLIYRFFYIWYLILWEQLSNYYYLWVVVRRIEVEMRVCGFGVETGLHRIVYLIFICSLLSKNDSFWVKTYRVRKIHR